MPELIALTSEFVKIKQYHRKNGDIPLVGASMSSRAMRVGNHPMTDKARHQDLQAVDGWIEVRGARTHNLKNVDV